MCVVADKAFYVEGALTPSLLPKPPQGRYDSSSSAEHQTVVVAVCRCRRNRSATVGAEGAGAADPGCCSDADPLVAHLVGGRWL